MANLIAGLIGQPTTTEMKGSTKTRAARLPLGRSEELYDILLRNLIGPSVALAETPISVPLQQAISATQDVMPALMNQAFGPGSNAGLAARLAGTAAGGIPPGPGVPDFGRLQTREELGLPARREAFPFTPTVEEIEQIGVPSIRTSRQTRRRTGRRDEMRGRVESLEERIARRSEAGKPTGAAERRLEKRRAQLGRLEI